MAKISGKNAAVYIGGAAGDEGATKVPGVVSFTLPERSRIDVTAAGDSAEAFILGLNGGSVAVETVYDASNSALESAITDGSAVEVHFYADEADGAIASFTSAYAVASVNTSGPNAAVRRTITFLNAAA